MYRRNRDLECLCVSPEPVTITCVDAKDSIAIFKVNRDLASLSFFKLCAPSAILESVDSSLDVYFTDGSLTYPGLNWLGNSLKVSTLKKVFCCCCAKDKYLTCFDGNDPIHIEILDRII